jgi:hypothetical protein
VRREAPCGRSLASILVGQSGPVRHRPRTAGEYRPEGRPLPFWSVTPRKRHRPLVLLVLASDLGQPARSVGMTSGFHACAGGLSNSWQICCLDGEACCRFGSDNQVRRSLPRDSAVTNGPLVDGPWQEAPGAVPFSGGSSLPILHLGSPRSLPEYGHRSENGPLFPARGPFPFEAVISVTLSCPRATNVIFAHGRAPVTDVVASALLPPVSSQDVPRPTVDAAAACRPPFRQQLDSTLTTGAVAATAERLKSGAPHRARRHREGAHTESQPISPASWSNRCVSPPPANSLSRHAPSAKPMQL